MTQVSSLHQRTKKVKPQESRLGKRVPRDTELLVNEPEMKTRVPDSMFFYTTPCHLPIL